MIKKQYLHLFPLLITTYTIAIFAQTDSATHTELLRTRLTQSIQTALNSSDATLNTKQDTQNSENTATVRKKKQNPCKPSSSGQSAGSLDHSFGNNGTVTTTFPLAPENTILTGLALLPSNNNIIAGGTVLLSPFNRSIVASYKNNGRLDTSFGFPGHNENQRNGYILEGLPLQAIGTNSYAVAITPFRGEAIVSAGNLINFFTIIGYGPNGGIPGVGFINYHHRQFPGSTFSQPKAMKLDIQNRLVIGGYASSNNQEHHFALMRTDERALLDTTFGNGGYVQTFMSTTPNNLEQINGVAIDPVSLNIIAAGQAIINGEQRFVLASYTNTGELNTSFGTLQNPKNPNGLHTGKLATDFSPLTGTLNRNDSAQAVTIQMVNGVSKILVAGYALASDGTFVITMARYNMDGSLDTTFGAVIDGARSGIQTSTFGTVSAKANAITLDANNRIIVAGVAIAPLASSPSFVAQQFIVARYTPSGNPDLTFGNDGMVITPFNGKGAIATSLLIDNANKIVAGGYNFNSAGVARFAMARYHNN